MEAPEKVYLYPSDRIGEEYESEWGNKPWGKDCVEYTCTDAFIEKLECWMNENFHFHAGEFAEGILGQFDRTEDAIDSFKNYMKGE